MTARQRPDFRTKRGLGLPGIERSKHVQVVHRSEAQTSGKSDRRGYERFDLNGIKIYLLIIIELQHLRPAIARELYQYEQRKEAISRIRLQEANPSSLWKLYQKLMSRSKTYPHLPPFCVFLELPAIKILQSMELVKAGCDVKGATAGKSCIIGMLEQQIGEWVDRAKHEMSKILNVSADWESMVSARRMTHPVLRLDARWKCKICNQVERRYEYDGCLDFAGVCHHQCAEEDRRKKKRGTVTRAWNASHFVRDEQVINLRSPVLGPFL